MASPPKTARPKVQVEAARILVSPAQSSKLTALRDGARGAATQTATAPDTDINPRLSVAASTELCKARQLIDDRCTAIMGGYPPPMRNKLFALRYGPIADLKTLAIKDVCKRLGLDAKQINLRLLDNLNYHGHLSK